MSVQDKVEVIAIIPARSGSKGLPGKNVRDLCGKPLLAYSIEAALNARRIDRVIVSTDSPEIAKVAEKYGAEVPFLRPEAIAGDSALLWEAVEFTSFGLGLGKNPDKRVAVLFPSHPFRNTAMMDTLVDKLIAGYSPVETVREIPVNPHAYFSMASDGDLARHDFGDKGPKRTEVFYQQCGTFSGISRGPSKQPYYHVLRNEIEWIDIDYEEDLLVAEEIIRQGLYDFNEGNTPCGA